MISVDHRTNMTIPRDIVIVDTPADKMMSKGEQTGETRRLPRPAPIGFRRCSLEHAKQVEEIKRYQRESSARRPPPRRSSLKSSSAYTSSSSAAVPNSYNNTSRPSDKSVAFDGSVRMKIIEFRDQAYLEAAWLSQEERIEIQNQARADVKTIKQLTKHPHLLEDSPELRQLRSSMSLRGLEQFYSKRIHRNLVQEQMNVIYDVLELQDQLNESSRSFGTQFDKEKRIAQVSTDGSLPARERAIVQGREDEAAIKKYLQRERSNSMTYTSSAASHTQAPGAPAQDIKPGGADAATAHISSRSLDDAHLPRPTAQAHRQQRRASMPTVRSSDAFSTDLQNMVCPKDDSNWNHP